MAGLIREAVRYTGDQETLPLCPLWIGKQLREVGVVSGSGAFTGEQLTQMLAQREWREGYLADRMQDEILLEQILVETEGERVGQINALSVIEFPAIPARSGSRPVLAALCILETASLPTSNAKPSWAETFTPKA